MKTTRRAFLGTAGAFLLVPIGCGATPRRLRSISALGDSLSDTVFFPDAYPRWLAGYFPGVRVVALGEEGDTTDAVLGRCTPAGIVDYAAIARLTRHRLHPVQPGQYCSVLAGINDILFRDNPSERITANLSRIYAYLRAHDSTAFPITILPWAGSDRFNPERETVRETVNGWVRAQPLAIDAEQLMGNRQAPPALRNEFDSGDGIHPNGRGAKVLAGAVATAMRRHQAN